MTFREIAKELPSVMSIRRYAKERLPRPHRLGRMDEVTFYSRIDSHAYPLDPLRRLLPKLPQDAKVSITPRGTLMFRWQRGRFELVGPAMDQLPLWSRGSGYPIDKLGWEIVYHNGGKGPLVGSYVVHDATPLFRPLLIQRGELSA